MLTQHVSVLEAAHPNSGTGSRHRGSNEIYKISKDRRSGKEVAKLITGTQVILVA